MAAEARSFIAAQSWCTRVESVQLAWAVAGVLGVFQVRLVPGQPEVDSTLWVVVGDLPSAYMVLDQAPEWRQALEGYVYEMSKWVAAVRSGLPLNDIIPVAAEPTLEHAQELEKRLKFIEHEVLAVPEEALASDA
jgi:hypothetical protein